MPSWKKVITSGSAASLSSLTTSGNISGSSTSTGSFGYGYIDGELNIGLTSNSSPAWLNDTRSSICTAWRSRPR